MSGYYTVPVTVTDSAGKTATASAATVLNDTRIGAAVPVSAAAKTYPAAISAFRTLVNAPLTLLRIENVKSPIGASISDYGAIAAAPPGCRLLLDLHPATDGSDAAAITSLLAAIRAAGFTGTACSVYHELGPFTSPAPFTAIFQSTADLIHAAGFKTVYAIDAYQIVVSKFLEPYFPGTGYVDYLYPDFYIGNGLAALPLAASFADDNGLVLGACETGVMSNMPGQPNYGTPAENTAFLTSVFEFFQQRRADGKPAGDIALWQGVLSTGADFTLTANTYAIPVWQQFFGVLNTTGVLA